MGSTQRKDLAGLGSDGSYQDRRGVLHTLRVQLQISVVLFTGKVAPFTRLLEGQGSRQTAHRFVQLLRRRRH